MDYVLVINVGTYCDSVLMNGATHFIKNKKLIFLGDEKQKSIVDRSLYHKCFFYKSPAFMLSDIDIGIADTQKNMYWWAITNPIKTYKLRSLLSLLTDRILNIVKSYKPTCILMHYAVFSLLPNVSAITSTPIMVVYHAPAIANCEVPWLFDASLKDRSYKLYSRASMKDVVLTWDVYMGRIALDTCKMRSVHHVLCWDRNITKPIMPTIQGLHIHRVGSIITDSTKETLVPDIVRFIKRKTVFVSFGSYAEHIKDAIAELLLHIVNKHEVDIVFHDNTVDGIKIDNQSVYVHKGFISYQKILEKVDVVMFTGSVCLQTICFSNQKPMIYVPLLTEQFFWAKNYEHFTGVPYVDLLNESIAKSFNVLDRAMEMNTKAKTRNYLKTVGDSMRENDGRRNIATLLNKICDQNTTGI